MCACVGAAWEKEKDTQEDGEKVSERETHSVRVCESEWDKEK